LSTLIVVGGAWIGVALLEQAGLMTIGMGAAEGHRLSWLAAARFVSGRFVRILQLGAHLLVRVLVIVAPVLALLAAVYGWFLREHDINYYLVNRPPEFLLAGGIAGFLVLALAAWLAVRILGWMYALPGLLFADLGARETLQVSVAAARGRRGKLFVWIAAWLAAGSVASIALTWFLGVSGRWVVPQTSDSIQLVAFTIGAVGLLGLAANLVLSFISAALFALLLVQLYRADLAPAPIAVRLRASGPVREGTRFRFGPAAAVSASVVALGASALIAVILVQRLPAEDAALVIAHRGAAAHAPENTMASVRRALDDGADMVEIDVQESADGVVVVFHDSDFMKTAGRPLKVWEAASADLERLDVGSWFDPAFADERVPTLEQVLIEARGRAAVNIELKYYGRDRALEQRVVEIVERTGMSDAVVVMSLKYDGIRAMRSVRPSWTYGLLTTVSLGNATASDVSFLAVNATTASRRFIRRAHAAGKDVYVWTVNDPFLMSAMMSRGVDGIITDDPGLARRVREFRSKLSPAERLLIGIGTEIGAVALPARDIDESDA
jgi:glycerophosphoryl diester phosphodiesterase